MNEREAKETKVTIVLQSGMEQTIRQTIGHVMEEPPKEKLETLGGIFEALSPSGTAWTSVIKTETTTYQKGEPA